MRNNIKFIIGFLLLVITIPSISCSWTYYDGPVKSVSVNIGVSMGKFDFTPYPNEYPENQEGTDNKDTFDKIIGGNVTPDCKIPPTDTGPSLANPNSAINKALEFTNILALGKTYITSEDYLDTDDNGSFDTKARDYFGIPKDMSFIITRETFDNIDTQYYSVYTTNEQLSSYELNQKFKYVYKTTLVWNRNRFSSKGEYTITTTGNVRGSCKIKRMIMIDEYGNQKETKFFVHGSFKQVP